MELDGRSTPTQTVISPSCQRCGSQGKVKINIGHITNLSYGLSCRQLGCKAFLLSVFLSLGDGGFCTRSSCKDICRTYVWTCFPTCGNFVTFRAGFILLSAYSRLQTGSHLPKKTTDLTGRFEVRLGHSL